MAVALIVLAGVHAAAEDHGDAVPVVRWGIMGTGRIASDFTRALSTVDGSRVVAVGSRTAATAEAFIDRHGGLGGGVRAHGSYEALAEDAGVDIVYIATPSGAHVDHSLLCLRRGRAVLCEKPLAQDAAAAAAVIVEARRAGRFFLHGVWSRFFPAMAWIRARIDEGAIGSVVSASASFCQNDGAGACSALSETGVYCAQFLVWAFGGQEPEAVGGVVWAAHGATGLDERVAAVLRFPGGGTGVLECSLAHASPRAAVICGTEGCIEVPYPFWCPTRARVVRMSGVASQEWTAAGEVRDALPAVGGDGPLNYIHSEGLAYEAREAARCVRQGIAAPPAFDDAACLAVMRTLDMVRAAMADEGPVQGA